MISGEDAQEHSNVQMCLQEPLCLHRGNIWEGRGHRNPLHAGPTCMFPLPLCSDGAPWPRDSGKEWAALLEGKKSLTLLEELPHTLDCCHLT